MMRSVIRMKYIPFGFIVCVVIYVLTFQYSYLIFGETPVNILGLGSRNGGWNLLINLMTYAGISLFFVTIIGVFIVKNKRWIFQGIIGCVVSVTMTLVYFILWYSSLVEQGINPI
jgi:hypothetical protein